MPYLDFGEKLPSGSKNFTRLKKTGDRIQFRIIGKVYAEGNHFFLEDDGRWNIVSCKRINDGESCSHCNKFFEALKQIPKIEDKEEYRKARDEAKKSVPGCEPGITYNFPVIDRDNQSFTILQATPGVRSKLEAEFQLGTKMFSTDFVLMNTGKHGKDKYALTKVDSKDTRDMSETEIKIVKDYEDGKLGGLSSNQEDKTEDLEV